MPTETDLHDIQGNIVQGYRFPHVVHFFGRVNTGNASRWRSLLAELVREVTFSGTWVVKPRWTLNLGLAHTALRALEPELAEEIALHFPAFADGMPERSEWLGDDRAFRKKTWSKRDIWLSVYSKVPEDLELGIQRLQELTEQQGLLLEKEVAGAAWVDRVDGEDVWREHFGFRDDISNPALADWPGINEDKQEDYVTGRGKYVDGKWVGIAKGEFLLGYVNEADENPLEALTARAQRLLKNGTFGVIRKLQQDVPEFRKYLRSQAPKAQAHLAARMIGRDTNGVPVVTPNAADLQNFTYLEDKHGASCPLGAHVRRANPRKDGRHRLLRRGITYGDPLPEGADDTRDRGLWFVAFNANIEDQFELIQKQWLDGPVGTLSAARDPISSTGATRNMAIEGDKKTARPPLLLMGIPRFVTCLGGQYYLVPGRAALELLAKQGFRGAGSTDAPEWEAAQ